ncbi:helix-turn-helix domain-containing protein [Haloarchaeobius amylolyticus]|uniref:helix-turn-helix domain-containing protein n=1 Tax=Haloarchaeobius amylolyticus TaxID=1198296 RepID=UPI00226F2889
MATDETNRKMTVSLALGVDVSTVLPGKETLLEPGQTGTFERMHPFLPAERTTLWVSGPDHESVTDELLAHPAIRHADRLDEGDERSLYELELAPDLGPVATAIERTGAMATRAEVIDATIRLTLRFRDQDELQTFVDDLETAGVQFEVTWKGNGGVTGDGGTESLTQCQRQTLWLAYERGYFNIPRDTSLSELADELGVSSQAVSERLRRAMGSYLATTMLTE